MLYRPFYDPEKTYEENLKDGPFGDFADKKVTKQKGKPQYNFFGHKVYSPFGIPAGPLINGKFVKAALTKGFDIVAYKTVRGQEFPCHGWPNILSVNIKGDLTMKKADGKLVGNHNFHEPLSITNSFGVPSQNPKFWQKDIAKVIKQTNKGQIIIGAFQGTKTKDGNVESYINDFSRTAKLLKAAGVKVFEVNLSCPNEGTKALLCFDTERSVAVTKAIKKEIGKLPLIVKIAYFEDNKSLKNFVKQIGSIADGISAINTIASSIVDDKGKQALPGENRLRCGVCGHSIKWAGLDMVKRLKKIRKELNYKYTIIGVGGVTSAKDFQEYRKSGADIVMSATGAMWNPHLAEEIKKQL